MIACSVHFPFIQFQKYMKKMPWKTWNNSDPDRTWCRVEHYVSWPSVNQEGADWCIAVCWKLLPVYDSLLPKQTLNASCSVTWTPAGLQTAHYWLWGGHQSSFWLPSFKFGMNGGRKKREENIGEHAEMELILEQQNVRRWALWPRNKNVRSHLLNLWQNKINTKVRNLWETPTPESRQSKSHKKRVLTWMKYGFFYHKKKKFAPRKFELFLQHAHENP